MAGANKIVKKNQIVFKAGDKSDGMYLIRKGEVCVYLEKDGKEVILAKVGEGGMVGEMALFDQQPRSASVRATLESEVTLISTEDFAKLMKQIPKWFVGLMTALSTRLRQTNERLKNLESSLSTTAPSTGGSLGAQPPSKPFQAPIRILSILNLLWSKDGEKDGKDWLLGKQAAEKQLTEVFSEDPEQVRTLIELLVKEKILVTRQDSYKNVALALQNRALLSNLSQFMIQFKKISPQKPYLGEGALSLLRTLDQVVQQSPYDSLTVSLQDLQKQAGKNALPTQSWAEDIKLFAQAGDEVKLVNTSAGPGLKTTKKDCSAVLKNHELMSAMAKAQLL